MTDDRFGALRRQLDDAAASFAGSHQTLADVLTGMVDDVERAMREPLEVFPVCHHSPSSGMAMARRLRQKAPRVIYLELCEDLRPLLKELHNCRLPVALQAFAAAPKGFGDGTGPMSVVAPLTEASAEYQAIVYALDNPDVELVFVDRSSDHVFQWGSRKDPEPEAEPVEDPPDSEEAALHGDAVGVEIGDLRPRFAELEEYLLHHGKVRHWSEWWDQFVEQPLVGADYDTYRQVMTLIGSLFRRLTPPDSRSLVIDEDRERYMWTRIREHLVSSGADPATCMYVCGAFHASSRVEEFGLNAPPTDFAISERSETVWQYGLIPSSHSAIEAQFGLAPGSVSIAAETWKKALKRNRVTSFTLGKKSSVVASPGLDAATEADDQLSAFLVATSEASGLDEDELLRWCVDIVRLARKNGYLASTADAIAVFETSILLAGMRNRSRPTPYDFADAAVTCIEKESVPGRRDVRRLCEIMLGGDRIGTVGYDSLPPLARDVFDRLEPLGIDGTKRNVQRVLIDLTSEPQLRPASRLLWILRRLLPSGIVRPIMGVCTLEEQSIQESWDVSLGRDVRPLIELGYLGVTVEQVLEQRLRRMARSDGATAARTLEAVEEAIVYLDNPQLVADLGARAVELLAAERNVDDAPEVLRRIRRLLSYYRTRGVDLPEWIESFVTVGYAHYCTLLPTAFAAEDVGIRQVGAMVGFLVSMEGLALSLGCDRSQLELAVKQSHPETPGKVALRWAVQYQLGSLSLTDLRERCAALLDNPLVIASFPQYLGGFVQTLDSIPRLTSFVVELMSTAFSRLPDAVLVPWLPNLITTLKDQAPDLVPLLVREAGRTFPARLDELDTWTPPWLAPPAPAVVAGMTGGAIAQLLDRHRAPTDAHAASIGATGDWAALAQPPAGVAGTAQLLADHGAAAQAHAALLE